MENVFFFFGKLTCLNVSILVASAGHDDGAASADHRPAPQGGQHQWSRDEKSRQSFFLWKFPLEKYAVYLLC